jgi:hypothetical protein
VNQLVIGHQGVTSQRIVVLKARQLADADDCTVNGTQRRIVAWPQINRSW